MAAAARVAYNSAHIAQLRETFIDRLKPVASRASSTWICHVARAHLLGVKEWMLHERNVTIWTGRYGILAHDALHTVQLREAVVVQGMLLTTVKGAFSVDQVWQPTKRG
jgi:hypothetical protein